MRESLLSFFSASGLVQRDVVDLISDSSIPTLNRILSWGNTFGISEYTLLLTFGGAYFLSLFALLLGMFTHASAFIAWLLHWTLMNTGYSGAYGADMYAHIFLFYLVWVPSGAYFSLDRVLHRVSSEASFQARLGLRVIQLHLCVSYFASGIEKASGSQWWNGEVIWRALNLPGYCPFDMQWLAHFPVLATVLGLGTLLFESLYCVFIWPRKTRLLWVIGMCSLHLSIAIFLKLYIFGILMCIPTLSCFAFSAKPEVQT